MGLKSMLAIGLALALGCEAAPKGSEECRFDGIQDVTAVRAKGGELEKQFEDAARAVIASGKRMVLAATTPTEFGSPEDTLISSGSGLTAPHHAGLLPGPIVFDPDTGQAVSCARSEASDEVKCVLAHGVKVIGPMPEIFADGFESIVTRTDLSGSKVSHERGRFQADFRGLVTDTEADLSSASGVCGSYSKETHWDSACEPDAGCEDLIGETAGRLHVLAADIENLSANPQ